MIKSGKEVINMYLDEPDKKVNITDGMMTFIANERKKRNLTGRQVSDKIGRQQSWIAQIESGRIRSIKQQDLVTLFSAILNVEMQEADNYLSLHFNNSLEDESQMNLSFSEILKLVDKCINDLASINKSDISLELKERIKTQLDYQISLYKEELRKLVDEIALE
jgi:transcriptional regulator with XRE-family HTH domain